MPELRWPDRWPSEAVDVVRPYVGTADRLDILVGDPAVAISGTRLAGHLFAAEDGAVMIVHDRSGRPDVFPCPLLSGPVLVIELLRPRRRALELYRHRLWRR